MKYYAKQNSDTYICMLPILQQGEEPLFVNAKQYHRIMKRREARAKLEAQGKIPKARQVCIIFTVYLIL